MSAQMQLLNRISYSRMTKIQLIAALPAFTSSIRYVDPLMHEYNSDILSGSAAAVDEDQPQDDL